MHGRKSKRNNSIHISNHHDNIELAIYLNLGHYHYVDEISMAKLTKTLQ